MTNRRGREPGSRTVTPQDRAHADDRTPPPERDCDYFETDGRANADARRTELDARRSAGS